MNCIGGLPPLVTMATRPNYVAMTTERAAPSSGLALVLDKAMVGALPSPNEAESFMDFPKKIPRKFQATYGKGCINM